MNEHMKNQLEVMNQQVKELASIYNDVASKAGISDNELWIWYAILALAGNIHSRISVNCGRYPNKR